MILDNPAFLATSVLVGIGHTLAGPDHYLPFIVLSKARGWSYFKTLIITFFCGIGHIAGAVALGWMTIKAGLSLEKLDWIESTRGNLAGWALMVFGLIYLTWGLRLAFKKKSPITDPNNTNILAWALFVIFVLGPCEPLIPIMVYPTAIQSSFEMMAVIGLFGLATIVTMLSVVSAAYFGFNFVRFGQLERFSHALAGFVMAVCGFSIQFLGL